MRNIVGAAMCLKRKRKSELPVAFESPSRNTARRARALLLKLVAHEQPSELSISRARGVLLLYTSVSVGTKGNSIGTSHQAQLVL